MLVLASASPRRKRLLAAAGLAFAVEPADVDETLAAGTPPDEAAESLALRKTRAVLAEHAGEDLWIIGADTVVVVGAGADTRLLGKPEDAAEARRMLITLSGTRHRVVTGVAAARASDGRLAAAHETSWVTMRSIGPEEIETYLAAGEWVDKAGGYGIQESADAFITRLEGGYDNVVGLPLKLTLELLRGLGAPV